MKIIYSYVYGNKVKGFFESAWQIFILATLAIVLLLFAGEGQAAQINFSSEGVTVDVAPGETVAVPVDVSLSGLSSPYYYVRFGLGYTSGSLNRAWVSGGGFVNLNPWNTQQRSVFYISPPGNAAAGYYLANIGVNSLRSSEVITDTSGFTIEVNVIGQSACSQTPTFSKIASSENIIEARNNKPVVIELSGTVYSPAGCDVESLQYVLSDEYGEIDHIDQVYVRMDGSFAAKVEMIASRRGNDRDGRQYLVRFVAENEAGSGESDEIVFVAEHDNRKK